MIQVKKFKHPLVIIIWLWVALPGYTQIPLIINGLDKEIEQNFSIKTDSLFVQDSLSAMQILAPIIEQLWANAYLECRLDSMFLKDSIFYAYLNPGFQYKLMRLSPGNVSQEILAKSGVNAFLVKEHAFKPVALQQMLKKILEYAENSGYPFAKIKLDSIEIDSLGSVHAALNLQKQQFIVFDTLIMEGDPAISVNYLEKYLSYLPGESYNQSLILEVETKLKEIPYIRSTRIPYVRFVNNKASLVLTLEKKNASRFDLIIGVLPNNANQNRLAISGDISIEMYNKINKGEHFLLQFERLKPETQQLDVAFEYPFLFDLPFGLDTRFGLFRNTNTNIDLMFDIGFQYFLERLNRIKFFWKFESSRLLDIDTTSIFQTQKLPNRLDVESNNLGFTFNFSRLDYRLNPRKGYQIDISGTAGIRTIIENNRILELKHEEKDFSGAYDSLDIVSNQFNIQTDIHYYFPLLSQFTLLLRNRTALKTGNAPVFQNEYFRIGGNKRLRGFDEQSILANFYSIFTAEFHLLTGTNSYLFVFGEYAYVRNEFVPGFLWDSPYSFGAGMNFETKSGIFGISLALGSEKNNPIDYRNAKTHFGFVSLF